MKVEIQKLDKTTKLKFPFLGILKEQYKSKTLVTLIVLFKDRKNGTVVFAEGCDWNIADTFNDWDCDQFEDFQGNLVMSNEE